MELGTPGVAARHAARAARRWVVLPLGLFWSRAEPPARHILGSDGGPAFEAAHLHRALWKPLADHVYHHAHAMGRRSPLAWPGWTGRSSWSSVATAKAST